MNNYYVAKGGWVTGSSGTYSNSTLSYRDEWIDEDPLYEEVEVRNADGSILRYPVKSRPARKVPPKVEYKPLKPKDSFDWLNEQIESVCKLARAVT